MMPNDAASWEESRRLIESALTRMEESINHLTDEIKELREDQYTMIDAAKAEFNGKISAMQVNIAMLQVKAGVWGLLGGCIPIAVAILVELIKK